MRSLFCLFTSAILLAFTGCGLIRKSEPVFLPVPGTADTHPTPVAEPGPAPASPASASGTVSLVEGLVGKVSSANENLKFAVITFPVGRMAAVDSHLNVYRAGLKVGELIVTGPQREDSTVADITAGVTQAGDEVREN